MTGPSVTTFYGDDQNVQDLVVGAAGFFAELTGEIPAGTTVTIPSGGDLIDEATGQLTGVWGTSGSTQHTGTAQGGFAAGVGARVVWETGAIRNGRRVRGSTFVVPIWSSAYDNGGTLQSTTIASLEDAIGAMLAQVPTQMRIWSRPTNGSGGAALAVVGGSAPDKVSWLRSRRT